MYFPYSSPFIVGLSSMFNGRVFTTSQQIIVKILETKLDEGGNVGRCEQETVGTTIVAKY